jgi:hypothetical protein
MARLKYPVQIKVAGNRLSPTRPIQLSFGRTTVDLEPSEADALAEDIDNLLDELRRAGWRKGRPCPRP